MVSRVDRFGMKRVGTELAAIDREEHRADVYLSRPEKRNAMTVDLMQDLTEAFQRIDADDDVWAATLLGEGPVFCAGMALEMMRDRLEPDSEIERDVFPTCSRRLRTPASRSSPVSNGPRQLVRSS